MELCIMTIAHLYPCRAAYVVRIVDHDAAGNLELTQERSSMRGTSRSFLYFIFQIQINLITRKAWREFVTHKGVT